MKGKYNRTAPYVRLSKTLLIEAQLRVSAKPNHGYLPNGICTELAKATGLSPPPAGSPAAPSRPSAPAVPSARSVANASSGGSVLGATKPSGPAIGTTIKASVPTQSPASSAPTRTRVGSFTVGTPQTTPTPAPRQGVIQKFIDPFIQGIIDKLSKPFAGRFYA